ncbi:peptidylprolyl isomerase [Marinitoga sp. 38H-ov]|uniref:peptidylprolyl isomerase n=1 Tax=Marinitoga sp. 38H-ov TaxID=1755814 RepID=UPI0013E9B8CA|nr:peptidylprolyl isomerase [Marinitoga sp. 38H-ov]KAF2955100.1 hypothetical protein AS160_02380 [Marinitoga sp. 38H-ov]
MKKNIFFIIIMLLIISSFGAISYKDLDEKTIVIINDEIVNYDYFQSQAKSLEILRGINNINNTFYKILVGTNEGNSVVKKYEKYILDRLSGEILFIQYVESKGINLSKNDLFSTIKNQTNEILNSSSLNDNDIMLYFLSKGFENKDQYIYNIYHERLYKNSVSSIYQYLLNNVEVTNEEIKNEYEQNKEKYFTQQSAELKMVFFKSSDEASLTYKKIIDGYYTFDEVYNTSNESTSLTISVEDESNEFIKTIKNSVPGAILDPVKYNDNYFALIKINKKIPRKQMTLEDATNLIIENIKDEKAKQLFDKLITSEFQQFKSNSEIIINSKYFKGDEINGN